MKNSFFLCFFLSFFLIQKIESKVEIFKLIKNNWNKLDKNQKLRIKILSPFIGLYGLIKIRVELINLLVLKISSFAETSYFDLNKINDSKLNKILKLLTTAKEYKYCFINLQRNIDYYNKNLKINHNNL